MIYRISLSLNLLFFSSLFLNLPITINSALAENQLRPLKIDTNSCTPKEEICGSGMDEDCDGVDLKCPGDDGDRDGFPASEDCDDGDKFVYPGISVSCKAACGDGVKTCNAGGYTTCTCTPLCEKLLGGRCFYIDPIKGNDNNSGSFSSPLKTLKRLSSYYITPPPANKIDLVPGDTIYLKSGIYDQAYQFGEKKVLLYLLSIEGTSSAPITFKSYPGHTPLLKLPGDTHAISLIGSSWINLQGLTIDNSLLDGIWIADGHNFDLGNLTIRNTDGVDNNNLSGLKLTKVSNLHLHHSILHDNYDRTNADTNGNKTENSRNMVIFGGGDIKITYSNMFHSQDTSAQKTGTCLSYKHGPSSLDSTFEVGYNIFSNCYASAIGTAGHGGHFHHNLFINNDVAIYMHVYGQPEPPFMGENLMEFNTAINTPFLSAQFSEAYAAEGTIGANTSRNNIAYDKTSYSPFLGMYTIDPYGKDSLMNEVKSVPYLLSNNNCFFNPNESISFAYYSSSNGPNSSGGSVNNLNEWKELGFDLQSLETNPQLSPNTFLPINSSCTNKGIYAE